MRYDVININYNLNLSSFRLTHIVGWILFFKFMFMQDPPIFLNVMIK